MCWAKKIKAENSEIFNFPSLVLIFLTPRWLFEKVENRCEKDKIETSLLPLFVNMKVAASLRYIFILVFTLQMFANNVWHVTNTAPVAKHRLPIYVN